MAYATETHSIWNLAPSGAALSKGNSTSPYPPSLCCGQRLLWSMTTKKLLAFWGPLPSQGGSRNTETEGAGGIKSSALLTTVHKTPERRMSTSSSSKALASSSQNTSQQHTKPSRRHAQTNYSLHYLSFPQPFSGGNFILFTSVGRFPVHVPENLAKYEERHVLIKYSHNCTNAQLYISNALIHHSIRTYTWAVPMKIWGSEHRIRPSFSWSFCHQWRGRDSVLEDGKRHMLDPHRHADQPVI